MMVSLSIFFVLLLVAGFFIQISSLARYSSFVITEGEIVAFIEKIGGKGKQGNQTWFREPMPVAYLPVVAYRVGDTIYEMEAGDATALKQPDFRKRMQLVYNPYEPGESYIKEGTPFLGLLLVGIALLGFIGLLIW
jgi:hypothetical protein